MEDEYRKKTYKNRYKDLQTRYENLTQIQRQHFQAILSLNYQRRKLIQETEFLIDYIHDTQDLIVDVVDEVDDTEIKKRIKLINHSILNGNSDPIKKEDILQMDEELEEEEDHSKLKDRIDRELIERKLQAKLENSTLTIQTDLERPRQSLSATQSPTPSKAFSSTSQSYSAPTSANPFESNGLRLKLKLGQPLK